MSNATRPTKKIHLADWFSNQHALSSNSEREQQAAIQVRDEACFLRNETDNRVKWNNYESNMRLADRIDDIRKWKEIMETARQKIDSELQALSKEKFALEHLLEEKNVNVDVNSECLVLRDSRRDCDNVVDDTEMELLHEKELIADVIKRLQDKISEAFYQLCLLQEARRKIISSLEDKEVTLNIDCDQYNVSETSDISYKPESKGRSNKAVSIQEWEDLLLKIIEECNKEIDASQRLRESSQLCGLQVESDLVAQNDVVNFALRKRVHELARALQELNWQKEKLETEIQKTERDLHNLEEAIRAKIPLLKMAETRLENRFGRPNEDFCHDSAQIQLEDEIAELKNLKTSLEEKQADARNALDRLQKQHQAILRDIAIKSHSYTIDTGCVDIRKRLEATPLTRENKGLSSLGILREKSKVVQ